MLRVLFLGENWFGSCARACCYALRRAGCEVADIDIQTVTPQWRQLTNRVFARLLRARIVREYNELILDSARQLCPDVLLAFKGSFVEARTLHRLRSLGITLYNYYPDTSPVAHDRQLAKSIREYDCIFYTKKFWSRSVPEGVDGARMVYVPHGYDPEVHQPVSLTDSDIARYSQDVLVVAGHTSAKEEQLSALVAAMPKLRLAIYGPRWTEQTRSSNLREFIRGVPLYGLSYAKAVCASRICLGILSGKVRGVKQGDETSTRSFEIPACGGFMLHERTPELQEHYEEGREVACFGSTEELAEKITYYLAHSEERQAMASAGHLRCVPAYSYDCRMTKILEYHARRGENGRGSCSAVPH